MKCFSSLLTIGTILLLLTFGCQKSIPEIERPDREEPGVDPPAGGTFIPNRWMSRLLPFLVPGVAVEMPVVAVAAS